MTRHEKAMTLAEISKSDVFVKRMNDPRWLWEKDGRHLRYRVAEMVADGGRCFLCGKEFREAKEAQIDHDHKTGMIRGILCRDCNMGLGCFRDDPDMLIRAWGYLSLVDGYVEPAMAARAAQMAEERGE